MKTLQLSIIAVTGIILIVGTNLAFAEVQLNNAILAPFEDNELVLVGKVNDVKNMSSKNNTQYSITVEKYLKNSKPFDLLTATGYGTRKEITNPYQENYFNQPVFEKGDRVFLYLNQKDGQYVLSPFSFIISEHIPPGTAITVIPNKNNYYGNENVSILGVINKGHLYTSAAEYGKNSTVSITVSNPNNAKYLTDQINVKPDGSFIYQFKIKGKFGITGGYGAFIDAGGSGSGVTFDYVADPLNQFKLGIAAKDVQCEEKLQLVIKLEGGSPACVKLASIHRLVLLHWALKPIDKLTVEEFKDTYKAGEKIDFVMKFKGLYACGYPSALVKNTENKTVWQSPVELTLCDPDTGYGEYKWKFGELYNVILNQTGSYYMYISFSDKTLEKEFAIQ